MASLLTVSHVENAVPGRYIVTLKDNVPLAAHVSTTQASIASSTSNITHEFNLINGYVGEFTDDDLNDLRSHPDIASIEQDSIGWLCDETTQADATWGLGRISSSEKLTGNDHDLNFEYRYDSSAGKGVNVYVMDTGIQTDHPAFEGRASWGKTLGPWPDKDDNGHGTHCAGTAVSGPYGVAKASKVIAVKVVDYSGYGFASHFIEGADWIAQEAERTGVPSVVTTSLCYNLTFSINAAVKRLYDRGVTVVAAAGNKNLDAKWYSPARSEQAITVGASDINDTRADFSNHGACVNVWAPGVNVTSTWNDGGTKTIDGTSMATPHVAGFAAYLLGLDPTLTPARIAEIIDEKSLKDVLAVGTVNKLLNNPL